MEVADVACRIFNCLTRFGVQTLVAVLDFLGFNLHPVGGEGNAVEFRSVFQNRLVTPCANVIRNLFCELHLFADVRFGTL